MVDRGDPADRVAGQGCALRSLDHCWRQPGKGDLQATLRALSSRTWQLVVQPLLLYTTTDFSTQTLQSILEPRPENRIFWPAMGDGGPSTGPARLSLYPSSCFTDRSFTSSRPALQSPQAYSFGSNSPYLETPYSLGRVAFANPTATCGSWRRRDRRLAIIELGERNLV
jgi:hypothetical protein